MTTFERNSPRPQRRVVVTGLGAISSLGTSADGALGAAAGR